MTLSNYQVNSKEAAKLVGVSVPTLFRFAGSKAGKDGALFPEPERLSARHFVWDVMAINRWVEVNGKAVPSKRGRPKGSFKKPREEKPAHISSPASYHTGILRASSAEE